MKAWRELRRLASAVLYQKYRLAVPLVILLLVIPVSVQQTLLGDGPTQTAFARVLQLLRMVVPFCAVWVPAFCLRDYVDGDASEVLRAYTAADTRQWRIVLFCNCFLLVFLAGLFAWIGGIFVEFRSVLEAEFKWQIAAVFVLTGLVYFLAYSLHSSMAALMGVLLYHCLSSLMSVLPTYLVIYPTDPTLPLTSLRGAVVCSLILLFWGGGWAKDKLYTV